MKYRAELDGLRAIAVVPVILFHAGLEMFSGGFVGVDIFFVISGYLITTILVEDIEKDRFSLIDFYVRRARRILPALFIVLLFCMPFAWLWMLPSQLEMFSKSLIAVSLFSSNIFFWRNSGYFDADAEENPLLHTWSLAVEEQYYLLFPIFLLMAWRFGKVKVFWMIVLFSVISLALSEWGWRNSSTANFYLAPTRAWELFSGSIAAFIVQKRGVKSNNLLSLLGFMAIVFSIFFFDKGTPFPSVYALVPVAGAVLLIVYAASDTYVAKLLSTKIFIGIGLVSYSAYLWHQPFFAFARIKLIQPSLLVFLTLASLSFLFAFFSWKYIEQPFRKKGIANRAKVLMISCFGLMAFMIVGAIGIATNGFGTQRYDREFMALHDPVYLRSSRSSMLGNLNTAANWILIGDSHADALQEALSEVLSNKNQSAIVGSEAGCPPAMNLLRHDVDYKMKCHDNYADILKIIEDKKIENVMISARYALYLNSTRFDNGDGGIEKGVTEKVIYDHLDFRHILRSDELRHQSIEHELVSYIEKLSNLGANIYMITSIPEVGWDVPKVMQHSSAQVNTRRSVYDERVKALDSLYSRVSQISNVTLLHSEDILCNQSQCVATDHKLPLYYDTNHPSIFGAKFLLDNFSEKIFGSKL